MRPRRGQGGPGGGQSGPRGANGEIPGRWRPHGVLVLARMCPLRAQRELWSLHPGAAGAVGGRGVEAAAAADLHPLTRGHPLALAFARSEPCWSGQRCVGWSFGEGQRPTTGCSALKSRPPFVQRRCPTPLSSLCGRRVRKAEQPSVLGKAPRSHSVCSLFGVTGLVPLPPSLGGRSVDARQARFRVGLGSSAPGRGLRGRAAAAGLKHGPGPSRAGSSSSRHPRRKRL